MHYSPQIAVLEGVTCSLMLMFYFWHSWHYDRFQPMFQRRILKHRREHLDPTNSFHLVMRFIYLLCLPVYIIQGIMVAYIKYQVGYLPVEMGGYPVPYTSWPPEYSRLIFVIYYLKAVSWSGEGIVHMEELAFWIFLIHLKDTSPTWFKSRFFQAFIMLSILSIGIMVCIVSVLKPNVMLTEGVLMTVATGFNTLITCAFFWVFSKFPSWLRDLTKRSAPPDLIVRLYGFGTLNQIRMCFRLIFVAPLCLLSADGLRAEPVLNKRLWVVDLIAMTSTVAFAAQGVITLLIFLPRNLQRECGFDKEVIKPAGPFHRPLITNQSFDSLYLPRSPSEPINQSTCFSPLAENSDPTLLACVFNESNKVDNIVAPRRLQMDRFAVDQPSGFSQLNTCGGHFMKKYVDNDEASHFMRFETPSSPTRPGYEMDKPALSPRGSVQLLSDVHVRGTTTPLSGSLEAKLDFQSEKRSTKPSKSASDWTASFQQGNSVSFPISSPVTHFPRYFAPSERRVDASQQTRSISSYRTISDSPREQYTTSETEIHQPRGNLGSIHPVIQNFQSPIHISSSTFIGMKRK